MEISTILSCPNFGGTREVEIKSFVSNFSRGWIRKVQLVPVKTLEPSKQTKRIIEGKKEKWNPNETDDEIFIDLLMKTAEVLANKDESNPLQNGELHRALLLTSSIPKAKRIRELCKYVSILSDI